MNITAINSAIISGQFNNDELTSIIDAVKYARAQVGRRNINGLKAGQKVSFESRKLGGNITGTVVRVMQKNVVVNCGQHGQWRVPANMLSVV